MLGVHNINVWMIKYCGYLHVEEPLKTKHWCEQAYISLPLFSYHLHVFLFVYSVSM